MKRCGWCTEDPLYVDYHDQEWGVPVDGVQPLFERLVLEGMQAGLSWLTVLKKRAHMQEVFFGFEVERLARAGKRDFNRWLKDPGIIRHRGKLEAMVGNAQRVLAHEDFSGWIWSFEPSRSRKHRSLRTVPSETAESIAMSKALKKDGYRFVGPTICYAFMQSIGMVNDHVASCWRHAPCQDLRGG